MICIFSCCWSERERERERDRETERVLSIKNNVSEQVNGHPKKFFGINRENDTIHDNFVIIEFCQI